MIKSFLARPVAIQVVAITQVLMANAAVSVETSQAR
jgi:hypothetical protein